MSRVPLPIAPPLPREIQVEVTAACNLRCRMCLVRYRPAIHRVAGSMPFELFRRVVDALPSLSRVTLQGLGEPLLAPDLFRMIEHARSRGLAVGFNTNATLLHRRAAERLVRAELAWLCVSVDGATAATYESIRDGARFADVERNVRGLVAVMRERRASLPALSIVFVAMRRNVAELPAMVRLAKDWGVPALRVQNLSHSFDDAPSPEYDEIRSFTGAEVLFQGPDRTAEEAFSEARGLAMELGVSLRLPALREAPPRPRAPGEAGCDWPWRSSYVKRDGKTQPCCMLMGEDRAILGDAAAIPFEDVWRGPSYRSFREALASDEPPGVCGGCSMYRGVF